MLRLIKTSNGLVSVEQAKLCTLINPSFRHVSTDHVDALFERFGLRLRSTDDGVKVFQVWNYLIKHFGPIIQEIFLNPLSANDVLASLPAGESEYLDAVITGDYRKARYFADILGIETKWPRC